MGFKWNRYFFSKLGQDFKSVLGGYNSNSFLQIQKKFTPGINLTNTSQFFPTEEQLAIYTHMNFSYTHKNLCSVFGSFDTNRDVKANFGCNIPKIKGLSLGILSENNPGRIMACSTYINKYFTSVKSLNLLGNELNVNFTTGKDNFSVGVRTELDYRSRQFIGLQLAARYAISSNLIFFSQFNTNQKQLVTSLCFKKFAKYAYALSVKKNFSSDLNNSIAYQMGARIRCNKNNEIKAKLMNPKNLSLQLSSQITPNVGMTLGTSLNLTNLKEFRKQAIIFGITFDAD
ncbi:hypothetical protein M0813_09291 [Anaeramoeba flamelloides]|uniref:Uncharacterized protein n=1 Tax=Anaeramoeba flamelloides TaxID=1746091 RepID=A0AAV7Y5R0_9EUKA|nr:hypothetical protein M0812_29076 [Anaeramoeba flamelloides]KAJ6227877.1 hypothetical protein M0813_09291 [Anaeramoeba flamelloides]